MEASEIFDTCSEMTATLIRHSSALSASIRAHTPAGLRSAISADDILDDLWIEAACTLASREHCPVRDYERWLKALALRSLRTAVRTARAQKHGGGQVRASLDDADRSLAAKASVVWLHELNQSELAEAVDRAIATLSPTHGAVIRLWMAGYSDEQIAGELHKTPAAVNGLLFRARSQLRAPLARALGVDASHGQTRTRRRPKAHRDRAS